MARFRFPVVAHEGIDGDSIRVWVDRGWGDTKRIICRLHGIDTPELRNAKSELEREAAGQVRTFVSDWVSATNQELETESLDKGVWVGRYWGEIFRISATTHDGLSSVPLEAGLAVPYSGGRRSWTEDQLNEILGNLDDML